MTRTIDVFFKPEREDPYSHDYEIRIKIVNSSMTNVIRLSLDEATELLSKLTKVLME